jgi:hypothetical protein
VSATAAFGSSREGELEFRRLSPVIPVQDLEASAERYRRLGFAIEVEDGLGTDSPTGAGSRST